jgi:hypothetical protein
MSGPRDYDWKGSVDAFVHDGPAGSGHDSWVRLEITQHDLACVLTVPVQLVLAFALGLSRPSPVAYWHGLGVDGVVVKYSGSPSGGAVISAAGADVLRLTGTECLDLGTKIRAAMARMVSA